MPWVFGTSPLATHSVVTSFQSARQASGHSPLVVVQETHVTRAVIRGTLYQYGSSATKPPDKAVRCAVVLWVHPTSTTILPGTFVEVAFPDDAPDDNDHALEPRSDTPSARPAKISLLWTQAAIVSSFAGKIRFQNYWYVTDTFVKSTSSSAHKKLFNNLWPISLFKSTTNAKRTH